MPACRRHGALLYGFLRTRDTGHGHVFNRIGWKNVCGAPMGKDRAIRRLGGGDIPAPSGWSSLPGQAVAGREDSRTVKRRRRVVDSARPMDTGTAFCEKLVAIKR
jgi:hypothetical protein